MNQNTQRAGYARVPLDLIWSPTNSAFATWDMTTSLGPIAGTGAILQWSESPQIQTDAGTLIFADNNSASITFQAVVSAVPEPGSMVLLSLGLGLGGIAFSRRHPS